MIEESPGELVAFAEVSRERLHAESLGGVVATVEDVDSGFFSGGEGPVRAFAGNEGVDAFLRGDPEFGAGSSGNHPNPTAGGRVRRGSTSRDG
jgi:hypothetical protein